MITVKNYLDRLQFSSAPSSDALGLAKLQERHLLTVPFENLDIVNGVPIVLDEESILQKVVSRKRGGFCYELNAAFAWLLTELGFKVTLQEARVANEQGEFGIPFDHLALRVDLDRPYLVDVGFGRGNLCPLAWNNRDEVRERGGVFCLSDGEEDDLVLKTLDRKTMEFTALYRVNKEPHLLEDFAGACSYHQSSSDSVFTQGLLCSMAAPDGRITIRGNVLTLTRNGRTEARELPNDEDVARELKRYFGISLS